MQREGLQEQMTTVWKVGRGRNGNRSEVRVWEGGGGIPGRFRGSTRRGVMPSYPEVCRAQSNTTPAPRTAGAPSTLQPWRDEKITRRERERESANNEMKNGLDLGRRPTERKAGGEQGGGWGREDVEVVKK